MAVWNNDQEDTSQCGKTFGDMDHTEIVERCTECNGSGRRYEMDWDTKVWVKYTCRKCKGHGYTVGPAAE